MTPDTIQSIVDKSVLCWLATSKDGVPNVSPKEMFVYSATGHLVIANIASPNSVKNIRQNPQVCVSFIDVFVQKGLKIKGTAEIILNTDNRFQKWGQPLLNMAGERFPFSSLTLIKIDHVSPIVAPSYRFYPDETTEDDQVLNAMKTYGVKKA